MKRFEKYKETFITNIKFKELCEQEINRNVRKKINIQYLLQCASVINFISNKYSTIKIADIAFFDMNPKPVFMLQWNNAKQTKLFPIPKIIEIENTFLTLYVSEETLLVYCGAIAHPQKLLFNNLSSLENLLILLFNKIDKPFLYRIFRK